MVFRHLLITLLITALSEAFNTDFCSFQCGEDLHIGCNNPGKPNEQCENFRAMKLKSSDKKLILKLHNTHRKKVAKGNVMNGTGAILPGAVKMKNLNWDDDLEYLAQVFVLECGLPREVCLDTDIRIGQNTIDIASYEKHQANIIIKTGFERFYAEVENVAVEDLQKYPGFTEGKDISHFAQIVSAKTSKVGCALAEHSRDGFVMYIFTCHYDHALEAGKMVYKTEPLTKDVGDMLVYLQGGGLNVEIDVVTQTGNYVKHRGRSAFVRQKSEDGPSVERPVSSRSKRTVSMVSA